MNKKAISSLALIILMLVSAVIGGIIAYMLTIAPYVEMEYAIPSGKTTLVITDVYFNPEDARAFIINVMNPSYSVSNATITKIAINVKNESTLYDVVETEPSLLTGITVAKGKSVNITCLKVQYKGAEVSWGRFVGEFAGRTIVIHVFSPNASAANKEFTLPNVKLEIKPTFDPTASFSKFNLTVKNSGSENLTITNILFEYSLIPTEKITPDISEGLTLPAGETVEFTCKINWQGRTEAPVIVKTREGYEFVKKEKIPDVFMSISDVIFNENETESFEVTLNIDAYRIEYGYVNVTSVVLTLDNETEKTIPISLSVEYNSSLTFEVPWEWKEYRGRKLDLIVQTLQGPTASRENIYTPELVILKVLNKNEAFNLKDKQHFNITLQNHPSSLETVNITKIIIEEKGVTIFTNCTLKPGQSTSLYCTYNWVEHAGQNLTLTIYTNATSQPFSFIFPIPAAELNITNVKRVLINGNTYLNITIQNMNYSIWNLTISKVVVTFENQTKIFEQNFANQITVEIGQQRFLICSVDPLDEYVTILVETEEGIKASWSGIVS